MGKKIIVTEKPSVAMTYASVLGVSGKKDGYIENDEWIITWCVGHLIEMCYPDKYDPALKEWKMDSLPFLPETYLYDVIPNVAKQFRTIKMLYNRRDIDMIYYAGDCAREGIYIQALVRQMAGHKPGIKELVVWIDSYTASEIIRGINQAADYSTYQPLIDSGYERAIEDYAVGINFSRAYTVKYGALIRSATKHAVTKISVGRVMTCVLGMVVQRELEIKHFKPTPFYRIIAKIQADNDTEIEAEWKIVEKSKWFNHPAIYENIGFLKERDAGNFIVGLPSDIILEDMENGKETKKAPPLFNLAELQSECTKQLHISPDQTLKAAQSLYEKKMLTYPRSDARVLTEAVADEIEKNLQGLKKAGGWIENAANNILKNSWYARIQGQKKYVDNSKVNDHYAIIPTGQGLTEKLTQTEEKVFEIVVKRFLSIFYPPAEYEVVKTTFRAGDEIFKGLLKLLCDKGYYEIAGMPDTKEDPAKTSQLIKAARGLVVGNTYTATYKKKRGETESPKRYTSGSMILAMENAGNLIEDEDLRAQIKSSGIGTSATRAETIKKLVGLKYIDQNEKTQILTPDRAGFMVYEIVKRTIPALLNPKMTASWEKGLDAVAKSNVQAPEYRKKLEAYVRKEIEQLKDETNQKEIEAAVRPHAENPNFKVDTAPFERKDLGIMCPLCGGKIQTRPFGYACEHYKKDSGCSFAIGTISGVALKDFDVKSLVKNGRTRTIDGFESKKGKRKFSAALVMVIEDDEMKLNFDFSEVETPTLKGCKCPKCSGNIEVYPFGFRCENNHGNDEEEESTCDFFIGKVFGKKLTENQVVQLLQKKHTDLIKGFVSKNKDKKFDAELVLDENGKIAPKFPERKPAEESKLICPKCGNSLKRDEWRYLCDCGYKIYHTICKKQLTETQMAGLIKNGRSSKIDGFISKKGKRFSAVLTCNDEGEINFEFD